MTVISTSHSYETTSNGDVEVKVGSHIHEGGPIPKPDLGNLTDEEIAKLLEDYENVLEEAQEHISDVTTNLPELPVRDDWKDKLDDLTDSLCLPEPGDWDACLPDSIC